LRLAVSLLLLLAALPVAAGYEEYWVESIGSPISIAQADLDGDGVPEGAYISTLSRTMAFDPFGRVWEVPYGDVREIARADLDGDGRAQEVVLASNKIYALGPNGELLWSVPILGYSIVAFNLDGDEADEVVVGGDRAVFALDDDGSQLWSVEMAAMVRFWLAMICSELPQEGNHDLFEIL
jgi:outer membrane protein assembly factor BamB